MDDHLVGTADGLVGPLDQLGAGLGEHLDSDVLGDEVLLDDLLDEIEVGLRGGGKAHFYLAESHVDEAAEHDELAVRAHRLDQGLVAVAQIDAAPTGRLGDAAVGPGPLREGDLGVGLVLPVWCRSGPGIR